uniref:Uncharacterized protein n=1 Tax=Anguilla anguilla TaxID=7936 RepID=A0A0E9VSB3_ANGAN
MKVVGECIYIFC